MSSVLIDTNVWSELSRPKPDPKVERWMAENFTGCILSAIVLGEIRYGIALSEGARKRDLESFLDDLLARPGVIVADFGSREASIWGTMRAMLKQRGKLFGERDMLIAGHALSLGVPVVTRNASEMAASGATIINPWVP